MTEKDRKRLTTIVVALLVGVILWLLLRKAPLVDVQTSSPSLNVPTPSQAPALPGLNIPGFNIGGQSFNIGGITPQQIALSLAYGGSPNQAQTSSCGCDENSPINSALQGVATFLNQYQTGVESIEKSYLTSLINTEPTYISQYIQTAGGLYPGAQ
jgi:hypothetical protein